MKAEAQASGVLGQILAETEARLRARSADDRAQWERRAASVSTPRPFADALRNQSVGVIAEVKRRSPSAGTIREQVDPVALAKAYQTAGAAAISVLTEPTRFGGSLEDLEHVTRHIGLPVLRKDFIIDPVQLYEACAVGASAVLLIVRALATDRLMELWTLARNLGLDVLVEVHSEGELARTSDMRRPVIGVNARDLETLAMDATSAEALLARVHGDGVAVAESGLATRSDVERVALAGADAALVGTAAAGAPDPGAVIAAMVGVPRHGRGRRSQGA